MSELPDKNDTKMNPQEQPDKRIRTAAQREADKTPAQKREDVAYTMNHALLCGVKDVLDPFVTNWMQQKFGTKTEEMEKPTWHGNLREWLIGEATGDVGAVPVTIAFQRMAPGFMEGIGGRLEGAFGSHFRKGAEKASRQWAEEHNVPLDDPRVKERTEKLYRYEIDHLPQAAIWTVSSIGMNIGTQKVLPVLTHGALGNPESIGKLLIFKSIGAGIAAGALFTARSASPRTAHKWDRWMAEHVFSPAQSMVNSTLGLASEPTVGTKQEGAWRDRLSRADEQEAGASQQRL